MRAAVRAASRSQSVMCVPAMLKPPLGWPLGIPPRAGSLVFGHGPFRAPPVAFDLSRLARSRGARDVWCTDLPRAGQDLRHGAAWRRPPVLLVQGATGQPADADRRRAR